MADSWLYSLKVIAVSLARHSGPILSVKLPMFRTPPSVVMTFSACSGQVKVEAAIRYILKIRVKYK